VRPVKCHRNPEYTSGVQPYAIRELYRKYPDIATLVDDAFQRSLGDYRRDVPVLHAEPIPSEYGYLFYEDVKNEKLYYVEIRPNLDKSAENYRMIEMESWYFNVDTGVISLPDAVEVNDRMMATEELNLRAVFHTHPTAPLGFFQQLNPFAQGGANRPSLPDFATAYMNPGATGWVRQNLGGGAFRDYYFGPEIQYKSEAEVGNLIKQFKASTVR